MTEPSDTDFPGVPGGDTAPLIPEPVIERIRSCVGYVHGSLGVELDFTHETLPILDHYASQAREALNTRPQAAPLIAEALGAYYGQVLIRELAGVWRAVDSDTYRWLVVCQSAFLAVNPIGVGYDVLFAGRAHEGPAGQLLLAREDRPGIEARLAALPELADTDYFTFSSYFDVAQIAHEALRAEMVAGGTADVSFEWGDYEDELQRQGVLP